MALPVSLLVIACCVLVFVLCKQLQRYIQKANNPTKHEQENQQPTDMIELDFTQACNNQTLKTVRIVEEEINIYNHINDELYDTISESNLQSTVNDQREYSEQQQQNLSEDVNKSIIPNVDIVYVENPTCVE